MAGGIVQFIPEQQILLQLIRDGKARPSFVFDKEFSIEAAPKAYKLFNERKIVKAYFRMDQDMDQEETDDEREKIAERKRKWEEQDEEDRDDRTISGARGKRGVFTAYGRG